MPLSDAAGAPAEPSLESSHELAFSFTGSAREYFGIWLVNVLFTLLTLGAYSAWAKVRTRQYFYRHTWVDGSCFEYDANPRRILAGRAIVAAVLISLLVAKQMSALGFLVSLSASFALAPWALVKSLAFNARASSYRNVRFSFDGSVKQAYGACLQSLLACGLTLGVGYPYARYRLTSFATESHRFGGHRLAWSAKLRDYFAIYVKALGVLVPPIIASVALAHVLGDELALGSFRSWASLLGYAALLVPAAYLRARLTNVRYEGTTVAGHHFRSRLRFRDLLALYSTNLLAILLSFGLLTPWAKVRLARYKVAALTLVPAGSLDIESLDSAQPSSLGEALTDLGGINLDVGL